MSCRYSDNNGKCTLFDPETFSPDMKIPEKDEAYGCDVHCNCLVEDDEDPSYGCAEFEDAEDEESDDIID